MRAFRRIVLGLAVLLALAAGTAGFLVWRQLPGASLPPLPGLSAAVAVDLDGHGVPTIRAASLEDAFRVQGFLVARERMFQMDLMRRAADGRLSELIGTAGLRSDKLHRTYGFRQVAEQAMAQSSGAERRFVEAYAAGVNAYLASRAGRWGLEFQLLRYAPEPWRPEDSLKVLLMMHEDLSTSWKSELQSEALAALPAPLQHFLEPRVGPDDHPLFPDERPLPPDTRAFLEGAAPRALAQRRPRLEAWLEGARTLPLPGEEAQLASNNWVVAGSRTRSGKPLLANDPHLGLACPGIWVPLRIEWAGRFAQGVALPGIPTVIIGHNDRIAWGFTNLGTDLQDLYREPAIARRVERIAVKGGAPVEHEVLSGRHGPQVLPGLSLHWPALDPAQLRLQSLSSLMEARDWAGFNAAVDVHPGPPQNIIYADVDGHIGWRASGLVPIRRAEDDGSRIHDGADPLNDWKGFVAPADMPRVLDPADGIIATANNRTIGSSFPYPVATVWSPMGRAGRLFERLGASAAWDPSSFDALQRDAVSTFHRGFVLGLGLQEALPGFTGEADPGSPAYSRAERLRQVFRRRMLERLLEGSSLRPADYRNFAENTWILAAAKASPAQWVAAGLGDKAAFVQACLAEAKAHSDWNRPWGEVNRLRIKHPFGLGGGVMGWLFNPPPMELPGASGVIRVMNGRADFGQSMRMIVDLADLGATRLVLPLGASGHLGSRHRADQSEAWRKGDPEGRSTRLHQGPVGTLNVLP